MFIVKVEDVLRAAKVGRDNGTVAAFNDNFQKVREEPLNCSYRYGDFPGVGCAIGVGLSDEIAETIVNGNLNEATVAQLQLNTIKFEGDPYVLSEVQRLHDKILNDRSAGKDTAGAIRDFDRYLDEQLALLPVAA
jgi:hypothetical protein